MNQSFVVDFPIEKVKVILLKNIFVCLLSVHNAISLHVMNNSGYNQLIFIITK